MAMRKQVRYLYEFGPFCLDANERRLTSDGKVISLPPKVLDTLLVLVENSGRVLEKEELLKTLWPDSYVEESNLTTYVSQLRKALSENGDGKTYIETIPRRGYRFLSEVTIKNAEVTNFVFHERTDTRIIVEEEITEDDVTFDLAHTTVPLPSTVETEIPTTTKPLALKYRKALLISLLLLAAFAVGIFVLSKTNTSIAPAESPFQRMTINKLTANGNIPLAAISPDGKYVAQVMQETSNQSLWIRQTGTTSNAQIVPPSSARYLNPTYSGDGTYIYYVTFQGVVGTLYQIAALGGTPRRIIEDIDSPITFSPDGKKFAFIRFVPQTKESKLVIADVDGSNQEVLHTRNSIDNFSQDSIGYYAPSWSPDGKLIACAIHNENAGAPSYGVIAINPADKTEVPLTEQKWHWIGAVAWLPDGKGLVANAWDQGTSTVSDQIWHLTFPAGKATRVTNDVNSYKGISVAAKTGTIVTIQSAQVSRLWVLEGITDSNAIPIATGFGENYSEFLGLDWTPDRRIVYGSNASGNADIWIMDRDGKNQKQLTTSTDKDYFPVVSATGNYIVFVCYQGKIPHIVRMDLDGNNLKQLTQGQGEVAPSISSDGQWVAYSSFDGNSQSVYKVSIEGGTPIQFTGPNTIRGEYSPDGKWLAAITYSPDTKKRDIVIYPSGGGAPVKTLPPITIQRFTYLRWLSDSNALTFAGFQNGVSNIYKLPLTGADPTQLTHFKSDQIFRYAWSRDGKQIAVERGMPINDVILISAAK